MEYYGFRSNIKTNENVISAIYNEREAVWEVKTESGNHYTANFLISCVGALHSPRVPNFKGKVFYQL